MGSCGFDNAGVVTLTLPRINPHGNTCALLHFNQTLITHSNKTNILKIENFKIDAIVKQFKPDPHPWKV